MARSRRRGASPRLTPGTVAATAAGLVLILIPEPATTLTGAAIVTATWAPKILGKDK